ncbi:hypothetical protein B0H15DRAFT_966270 [Mycena belliarum]|uniref:Uncharacterized protein n=1 Tax=Mycena belliarum TaxID=1033014 RepID=A0AAD6TPP5_9AGAR|nr:hypothetical protein B0H15DRAFT_966270 [Mycena belliae]
MLPPLHSLVLLARVASHADPSLHTHVLAPAVDSHRRSSSLTTPRTQSRSTPSNRPIFAERTLAAAPNFRATKLILDDVLYHKAGSYWMRLVHAIRTHSRLIPFVGRDDALYSYDPTPVHDYDSARLTRKEEAHNEAIAHVMHLLLAVRIHVLSLAKQRVRLLHLSLRSSTLLAVSASDFDSGALTHPNPVPFLAALAALPPTLALFYVLGRLLSDPAPAARAQVRGDVLGLFVLNVIE